MNDTAGSPLPTEPFRAEHREIHEHLQHLAGGARKMPGLSPSERRELRDRLLGFLNGTLIPHAQAEEQVLYPEWAKLIGFEGASIPMIHDHEAIVARVKLLEAADPDDADTLQELLYGLYALITVHFAKEEDLQLPVFDQQSPEFVQEVLARMEAAAGPGHHHEH